MKDHPEEAEKYHNLGIALGKLGRFEEAISQFQKAVTYNPTHANAYYYWGNTLSKLRRYQEAIIQYKQAVRNNPSHADAYDDWGVALTKLGRYEEAISQFQHAVKYKSRAADIYYRITWCYAIFSRDAVACVKNLHLAMDNSSDKELYQTRVKTDPVFKFMHQLPEFQQLVGNSVLSPVQKSSLK